MYTQPAMQFFVNFSFLIFFKFKRSDSSACLCCFQGIRSVYVYLQCQFKDFRQDVPQAISWCHCHIHNLVSDPIHLKREGTLQFIGTTLQLHLSVPMCCDLVAFFVCVFFPRLLCSSSTVMQYVTQEELLNGQHCFFETCYGSYRFFFC